MMNKKIDIERLDKRNPYKVPNNYFTSLTYNIMDRVEEKERSTFFDFFTFRTLAPTLAIIAIVFAGFWNNNQALNITDEDLIELLPFYDVEDEILLEFIELESEEEIDDNLLNIFDYNELIYELQNQKS